MSTMVSSVSEKSVAGVLTGAAVGMGAVSIMFYALNRITLRYPPGSGGLGVLSNDFFAMAPTQAWLVGGLIAFIGVALASAALVIRHAKIGLAVFALGMCCTSILFGLILAL